MSERSKENKESRWLKRKPLIWALIYLLLCVAGGIILSGFFSPLMLAATSAIRNPSAQLSKEDVNMELTKLPQQSVMYASNGSTVIARFYTQNRIVVPLQDISTYMQKAVVAREDHRFLEHGGVSFRGIARAFVETYIKKGPVQGGSTLTQQYVKNALMDQAIENNDPIAAYHAHADTLGRKFREMMIAEQINKKYSKSQILQGYLNIAQFGVNIYGVQVAAERYFGIPAKDLNLAQSATIAAITKNPNLYDPLIHPEISEQQRNIVLDLMAKYGFASQKAVNEAKAIPMQSMLHPTNVPIGCAVAGHSAFFCTYVVHQILKSPQYGKTLADRKRLLYEGGLKIYTTLNVEAEQAAWNAVTHEVPVDDPSHVAAMMAAVQPGTGKILAIAQNRNYDASPNAPPSATSIDFAVPQDMGGSTGFGIGSAFKPINFATWLVTGHKALTPLHTSTVYPVDSFPCAKKTGQIWYLHNDTGGTVNPETPLHALIMSHNTTQASMAQIVGLCAIANTATAMGYQNAATQYSNIHSTITPTMIIGTLDTSPLTMANVYATIAANGVECNPTAIEKVINANGKEMEAPPVGCHQAIPANVAQTTAYAMNLDITQGIDGPAQLADRRKSFGKTGTNQNASVAFGGFVPQVSAFVIVADPLHGSWLPPVINGRYARQWYGITLAMPIWKQFMDNYLSAAHVPIADDYGVPDPSLLQ